MAERRIKRGWMNLRVDEIVEETSDTKTYHLVDADEGGRCFDYIAGQYLTFRFDTLADKPIVRSYTMSSSPSQPNFVAFTVKRTDPGFVSAWLYTHLKTGDILRARGPMGKFCFDPLHDKAHLCMIAAGSGVTPFISIMREYAGRLGQKSYPERMSLLVSYKSQGDVICTREIASFRGNTNIRVLITLTRENATAKGYLHGRISHDLLAKTFDAKVLGSATFMLCGPAGMMQVTSEYLSSGGVAPDHVKTESFAS